MKLPEDRKERIKILILTAIGVITLLVVSIKYGIKPMLAKRKNADTEIKKLESELSTASREIKKATRNAEKNEKILRRLRDIDRQYIFKPEYDNYWIRIEPYLKKVEKDTGIDFDHRDGGETGVPARKGRKFGHVMNSYGAQVTLDAGYEDLINLVKKIENDNPFASVLGINISHASKAKDPQIHTMSFQVHWPIWMEPKKMVEELAEKP